MSAAEQQTQMQQQQQQQQNQLQVLQQQQQINAMLTQLPEQQKTNIETAVNTYRSTLVGQGFTPEIVQTYVWSYYTQCVQAMFQDLAKSSGPGEEQSGTGPAPSASPSKLSMQHQQLQQLQMQQFQQHIQQQQMMEQGDKEQIGTMPQQTFPTAAAPPPLLGNKGGRFGKGGWQQQQQFQMQQMQGGMSMGALGKGGAMGSMAQQMHMQQQQHMMQGQDQQHQQDGSDGMGCGGCGGMGAGMQSGNMAAQVGMNKSTFSGMQGIGPRGLRPSGKGGPHVVPPLWKQAGATSPAPGLGCGGCGMMNGGSGVRFPLTMRPRVIRPAYPLQGGVNQGPLTAFARPGGIRPSSAPGVVQSSAAASGSGVRPLGAASGAAQFPPALQRWLQRLFAHQAQSGAGDASLQKQTHAYLRHWVQQWVKTGELWQRNWEAAALPTPDEIRRNLPPGSLSGAAGLMDAMPKAPMMEARPKAPSGFSGPSGFGPPSVFSRDMEARDGKRRSRERSRSRDGRGRRSRSPRRRRHRSPSSSLSRSRSRRHREASSGSSGSRERSADRKWAKGSKGKGKGKYGSKSETDTTVLLEKRSGSFEELRERVRVFINERLASGGRQKEITEELQKTLSVNQKRFRSFFGLSIGQYIAAYHQGGLEAALKEGPANIGKATAVGQAQLKAGNKVLTQGEQEMRENRAKRFQTHLQGERTPVSAVSFNDGEASFGMDGGPLVGELADMCSRDEAKEREMTRQLDKFEWKQGTDPRHPEVNLALATKKYQRSSADKAYRSSDVRNLDACWRTMEYLMSDVLDFDINPKPKYAVQSAPYIEVYSYLRDRTRAVRVDLHLQQPRSTTQRCFAVTHECCLRFEMLSYFLLAGGTGGSTEQYDVKLGLKAISQTIEPLLNSYQAAREKQLAKSILAEAMGGLLGGDDDGDEEYLSPFEMAVHRYIILLLMSFSSEGLLQHLARLSREVVSHPLVSFAIQVFAAFNTDDYGRFLRMYRQADFLTAVAMSGIADLARVRALYFLARTYPQPVGDKLSLGRIKSFLAFTSDEHARSFLAFHRIRVQDDPAVDGGGWAVLPKKGTPEAAACPLLATSKLPEKCEFPQGADSMLVSKFQALGIGRADLVFGGADPVVELEVAEVAATDDAVAPAATGDVIVGDPLADASVIGDAAQAVDAGSPSAENDAGNAPAQPVEGSPAAEPVDGSRPEDAAAANGTAESSSAEPAPDGTAAP